MSSLKTLCALLFLESVFCDLRTDPLVSTSVGLIRGLRAPDGDYSMFLGIPYAIVDKANPFKSSMPHPIFEETFEADDDSALCPQDVNANTITGTLDCLQLNVFTPDSAHSGNLLPVMVWIHGGFLQRGGFSRETYGPKFLVRHDIILITINYRVGVYGFMCLDTPEIPGNQGLKDQIVALKWIQGNIRAFGGDPTQVTLAGLSAGGAAIDFHLMYPGTKLFTKVILQSGVALTPARLIESDNTKPLKLAAHFGFVTRVLDEALSFLATIDTNLVIAATLELGLEFRSCVEKTFDGVEAFIPEHPANADRPKVSNIPVLIGTVDKEMLAKYINQNSDFFRNLNVFEVELDKTFDFGEDLNAMVEVVRNFYVGDDVMTEDDRWRVIDFESDFTYVHATQRAMRKYIESGAENIFFYVFTYAGGRNFVKHSNGILNAPGAAHADEQGYIFDPSSIPEEPTEEDQTIIDRMTTMWTNFVKYGNPTPETSELLPVSWTPITPKKWHCMNISTDLNLQGRPFHARMAFWDLFYSMNGKFEKGV
ncbi:esterase FE4-like [Choristoneura fumiferana]|uniref:esterase FE4-like n=1 Tax=Choristoneura fumiferana TaxID=7141 RepID=UPI003D15ABB3